MTDTSEAATQTTPAPTLAELDKVLLDGLISSTVGTLDDIHTALAEGKHDLAELWAEDARVSLTNAPTDAMRAEAINHINTWLASSANGHANTIRELIGLAPDAPAAKAGNDIRDALIEQCLTEAAATDDAARRDELFTSAMDSLAHLGPLAVARWRREFSKLKVDKKTFEQLLDAARAKVKADEPTKDGQADHLSGSHVKGNRLYFLDDALGNFVARITHELIVDDGESTPTVRYTVTGQLASGAHLDAVDVPAEEFAGMGWMARHWGARPVLYVPPSKNWLVRRAIQETSLKEMQRERVHTYSGWATIDGQRAYLTANGAITAAGFDSSVRVNLGGHKMRRYALPAPPEDARAAMQKSLEFLALAPLTVTLPLWAAMYAAPLTPLTPLNAVLWIYGSTQSRKSTLAMLALCHFGQGFVRHREYYAPTDWLSTSTALEGFLFTAKDLPLVVDDFAPAHTGPGDVKEMHKRAHNFVRSVGNRSSRDRANADLTEKLARPPRGLAIATSEVPLIGQSIVGRLIYVPVEQGQVAVTKEGNGPLDQAQAAAGQGGPGLYAQAMSGYVRWLAEHWPQMQESAGAEYETDNQFARSQFPSTQSRLMDYFAVLMGGARMGARFAMRVGAISESEFELCTRELWPAALVELLRKQSERVADQSPVRRFAEALADLLATSRAYLLPRVIRGVETQAGPPQPGAVLCGWYDPKPAKVFLLTNVCLQLVRDFCQRTGEPLDILPDALRNEFNQVGAIAEKDAGRLEKSVYVAGQASPTTRTLVLDATKLAQSTGVFLYPDKTAPAAEELDDNDLDATQARWSA